MLVGHQGRGGWLVESTGLKEDEMKARQYCKSRARFSGCNVLKRFATVHIHSYE